MFTTDGVMPDGEERNVTPCPDLGRAAYRRLLDEARTVSARTAEQLHDLRDRFPACLPSDLVDQVERLRTHPSHERRRGPRLLAPVRWRTASRRAFEGMVPVLMVAPPTVGFFSMMATFFPNGLVF